MTDEEHPLETLEPPAPEPAAPAATAPVAPSRSRTAAAVAGLVVAMLAAGAGGYAVVSSLRSGSSLRNVSTAPGSTAPGASSPGVTADPDDHVLPRIGVRQADVTSGHGVVVIPDGDRVTGTTTLDLCNGSFPSEALRTARLQVVEIDSSQQSLLSTEAVLYRNAAATDQAFAELRSVAAACPHRPVPSPSGGRTFTTTINAPPDRSWPAVGGVQRLAYDMTTVDSQGQREHTIAVYLRRGRALLGVYFPQPDGAQPAVAGRTTVATIVHLLESRLADLPTSVVNRG